MVREHPTSVRCKVHLVLRTNAGLQPALLNSLLPGPVAQAFTARAFSAFAERGDALLVELNSTATDVRITNDHLRVCLADGGELDVPLAWFPRLRSASEQQRGEWRFIGRGRGIHWPAIDDDISAASLRRNN